MVDIFDTLSTLTMTRAGSIWKGATPHTRLKRRRLRQHAEAILLPAFQSVVQDLLVTYGSEDGSNGYLSSAESLGGNFLSAGRHEIESRYTTCL